MSFLVIFLGFIAALFVAAFFTRRRFGVLGLALAAGAMLSTMWVGDLTPLIVNAGIVLVKPPLESVVAAALILLPAVLLLSSGPTYRNMVQRIIGSALFAILAIALLLTPLGAALVLDHVSQPVYDFFMQWRTAIITAALVLAIGDLLVTKTPKHSKEPKH